MPTRIAPGTSPPCTGELPFVRRTSRAQRDKRSPSGIRLAVSPLLPHQANAISSPPARLTQRLRHPVIRGLDPGRALSDRVPAVVAQGDGQARAGPPATLSRPTHVRWSIHPNDPWFPPPPPLRAARAIKPVARTRQPCPQAPGWGTSPTALSAA